MQVSEASAPTASVLRRTMVDCQLRTFEITDPAIIAAFEATPREAFVGAPNAAVAYSDAVLRVRAAGSERTLLAPMVLARMLQGAGLKSTDRALDIGGGLGYSAAVLAGLVANVTALESDPALTAGAAAALARAGLTTASAVTGPLEKGWPASGPYDFILINGAVEAGYEALFGQLAPGGRLVAVVREPGHSGRSARAMRFDRLDSGVIGEKWLFDAAADTLSAFGRAPAFVF